jgi:hypothetical protein
VNLCAPQRIHEFNHNGNDSKYLTEYNARATVPLRFTGYTGPQSLREDPLGAKCFRNASISLKNAIVLTGWPRVDADELEGVMAGLVPAIHVVRRIELFVSAARANFACGPPHVAPSLKRCRRG